MPSLRARAAILACAAALTASTLTTSGAGASVANAPAAARAAEASCRLETFGVDGGRRAVLREIHDGAVVKSWRSPRLGYLPQQTGFVAFEGGRRRSAITLATTTAGAPRLLTLVRGNRSGTRVDVSTARLGDRPQAPRLFSDGIGFFAYTVVGERMTRWTLTQNRRGALSYRSPVTVPGQYADLTALVASWQLRVDGRRSDVLHATTEAGELVQVTVPTGAPGAAVREVRLTEGYAGTTGLSFGLCDGLGHRHALLAVDGVAGTATWSTIADVRDVVEGDTVLVGPVAPELDWRLRATG